jgi:hypothetical protein
MIRRLPLPLLLALFCAAPAAAAVAPSGAVRGEVVSDRGQPLAAARVTIEAPPVVLQTMTRADGSFEFPDLRPGLYAAMAQAEGFTTLIRTHVEVSVALTTRLVFTLEPAEEEELVTETAESPLLDPLRAGGGTTVRGEELRNLALPRGFASLAGRVPFWSADRRGGLAAAGASPDAATWNIDGIVLRESARPLIASHLETETAWQVRFDTGGRAHYLETSGGEIDVVTRPPSDSHRGSATLSVTIPGGDRSAAGEARANAALEGGGPLVADRAWWWVAGGGTAAERETSSGTEAEERSSTLAGKIDLRAGSRLTFGGRILDLALGERGGSGGTGFDDEHDIFARRVESSLTLGPRLQLRGGATAIDRKSTGEAGSRELSADGEGLFVGTSGAVVHTFRAGTSASNLESGDGESRLEAAWLADEMTSGAWSALVAVRYDERSFRSGEESVSVSATSPRLALSRAFGAGRRSVATVGYSRFLDVRPGAHETTPPGGAEEVREWSAAVDHELFRDLVTGAVLLARRGEGAEAAAGDLEGATLHATKRMSNGWYLRSFAQWTDRGSDADARWSWGIFGFGELPFGTGAGLALGGSEGVAGDGDGGNRVRADLSLWKRFDWAGVAVRPQIDVLNATGAGEWSRLSSERDGWEWIDGRSVRLLVRIEMR